MVIILKCRVKKKKEKPKGKHTAKNKCHKLENCSNYSSYFNDFCFHLLLSSQYCHTTLNTDYKRPVKKTVKHGENFSSSEPTYNVQKEERILCTF